MRQLTKPGLKPMTQDPLSSPNPKISVAYARVSSREQALNSHALEQQIARLENAGADLVIYDVQSGKKDDRSGLNRILAMIENGEIFEVIITRIDRLGRRILIIRKCVDVFQNYEVNLRVLDQDIALGNPGGQLMLNLLASLAEMEVAQLSERVHHGNQHRRNKQLACSCRPFAFTTVDERYALDRSPFLCLLEERPANYQDLYQLEMEQLPGLSPAQLGEDCIRIFLETQSVSKAVRGITNKYGIQRSRSKKNGNDKIFHWTPRGLQRWLTNPVLSGHTAYKKRRTLPDGRRQTLPPEQWQIVRDTHPLDRLVTPEQAAQIHQILEYNAHHVGAAFFTADLESEDNFREFSYLRGLVFCAECGAKAITKTKYSKDGQKTYHYYACRHARKGCNNLKGTRKHLIEEELSKYFLRQSQVIIVEPNDTSQVVPKPTEKLKQLEADLANLEKMQMHSPDLERLKENLRQQIQDELNPFSQRSLERKTAQEIIQAGNNLAIWNLLGADERMAVIPRLVGRITVANGLVKSIELKA
ncbi:MAG: recombinase family protein [Symplocastrum torsivum CPER-KK1]|jgi:predicted site-specific integrase-resolvase|uniref:Recombinase family protein n=1 Tax=Symplocastrum torsivum CPER-KK1 TaxID=450513 RepID=A0A951PP76_9CYAN|nr:recombinase family protein [Symplocastrum torsivum CPER-KK1]